MADPVIGGMRAGRSQRRRDAAAAVVAADDHVADPKDADPEIEHGHAADVAVHDEVRDVAVHEDLPRIEARDLVGRYPTVGAADPQKARRLLSRQRAEEARALPLHAIASETVVRQEPFGSVHGHPIEGGARQAKQASDVDRLAGSSPIRATRTFWSTTLRRCRALARSGPPLAPATRATQAGSWV
ncbi:MAG: hypothetical protein Fur0037_03150 [Planctomycetota bacterium]